MCQINLSHAQIGLLQEFNSNSLTSFSHPTFSYESFLPLTPPPWGQIKRGIVVLYNFYVNHAQHVEISAQYPSLKWCQSHL